MTSSNVVGAAKPSGSSFSAGDFPVWQFDAGSYRDRTGRVVRWGDRIIRVLNASGSEVWDELRTSLFFADVQQRGLVVRTTEQPDFPLDQLSEDHRWVTALEHERIPFISYPYEWSWSMLRDATLLHLDLLLNGLEESFLTKDGSAYNIQWRGLTPTFIDIGSFCRWKEGEPWAGYRQFCQTFLFPLMLTAHRGIPFQPWLRGSLDGIEVRQISQTFGWVDFWKPGVMVDVWLHHSLQKGTESGPLQDRGSRSAPRLNRAMIRNNLIRLKRIVGKLTPRLPKTPWTGYAQSNSYSSGDHDLKQKFIREIASLRRWNLAWDLGCNTGEFSRLLAPHCQLVVAVDADLPSVEHLYQDLRGRGVTNILPLFMNFADPSPAQGWLGGERQRLEARGRPELTLALALIHHLVIGANLPMSEVIDWFADAGGELVIEFVGREDPMVKSLLRNKEDHYFDYDHANFESELTRRFAIEQTLDLQSGTRTLYHCRPKSHGNQ